MIMCLLAENTWKNWKKEETGESQKLPRQTKYNIGTIARFHSEKDTSA